MKNTFASEVLSVRSEAARSTQLTQHHHSDVRVGFSLSNQPTLLVCMDDALSPDCTNCNAIKASQSFIIMSEESLTCCGLHLWANVSYIDQYWPTCPPHRASRPATASSTTLHRQPSKPATWLTCAKTTKVSRKCQLKSPIYGHRSISSSVQLFSQSAFNQLIDSSTREYTLLALNHLNFNNPSVSITKQTTTRCYKLQTWRLKPYITQAQHKVHFLLESRWKKMSLLQTYKPSSDWLMGFPPRDNSNQ